MTIPESARNGANSTWVSVVGARPQFVKLAPVCRAIDQHNRNSSTSIIQHRILHTGQHYDREIAELLFEQMAIPHPDHNLGVGSSSHGTQLARMIQNMEPILRSERIDWVIVYGDTNSTLAGALLAARLNIPIAHVEAGCRSGDIGMPEEQNRVVADHLSQVLLTPSQVALDNLLREGIGGDADPRKRVSVLAGDVMYDALLQHLKLADNRAAENLRQFSLESKGYYLLTLHRAENTNNRQRLASILRGVKLLDLPVLFPVHPRTKQVLAAAGLSLNGKIRPIPPLGFLEMLAMEKHARKILTDSGGVQKEAFYLGVPCVTLRDQTEWPETVGCGANRIAGTEPELIRQAVMENHARDWSAFTPYGNGSSAEKIVDQLSAADRE
ncbi:MAG TPA: UDP-N-acetylglucosamine 2-epimerase (non-hydrolyzing) [Candidatus Acidoferrum sp.]